jgi:hypothetical protein
MDVDECFRNGMIKRTGVNQELINSLIEMSNSREITVKTAELNEVTISSYISLAYDSLREVLEAICVSKGYKVLSHICIGEFLRSIDKEFEFEDFDRFRYIRNGINYYGTKVGLSYGKEIIAKIFSFRKRLIERFYPDFCD